MPQSQDSVPASQHPNLLKLVFGTSPFEERLLQLLQASRNLTPAKLPEKVLAGVQKFSPGAQGDDLTLIVGRAR